MGAGSVGEGEAKARVSGVFGEKHFPMDGDESGAVPVVVLHVLRQDF